MRFNKSLPEGGPSPDLAYSISSVQCAFNVIKCKHNSCNLPGLQKLMSSPMIYLQEAV